MKSHLPTILGGIPGDRPPLRPDPMKSPPVMALDGRMNELIEQLTPAHVRLRFAGKEPVVLFLLRATEPRNVLDATTDINCDLCGQACWIAPSSKRTTFNFVCCKPCMGDELRALYDQQVAMLLASSEELRRLYAAK